MADRKKKDELRPEKVDGIEQLDNPLPTWWVALFNFSMIFGIGYFGWFHILNKPGQFDELAQERKGHEQLMAAREQVALSPEDAVVRLQDPKLIQEGKGLYAVHCSPCHGQFGEGTVGPNLTDKFWIHGGTPEMILGSITDGIPSMGMVAWGPILGQQKVEAVTAFVLSLQGTKPANGKAPQGDEY
jgi:cytochrome c oxidase cbb3-type subunit III